MQRMFAMVVCLLVLLSPGAIERVAATATQTQSASGSISGRVVDESTKAALPGALVAVEGTQLSVASERDGRFFLAGVPAGRRKLEVSYLGRQRASIDVDVTAGANAVVTVGLVPDPAFKESITVSAPQRDADERALNQQKNAPNILNIISADQIGRFPDPNAAEITQRVPGVSIQRDQGEGRYVIVRGMEPRLNATLINGERVPAPEADKRQVALDVVSTDLLQAVEVSKALTPDMDGDAIGGSVNLITKRAPDKFLLAGAFGGGYNTSLDSYRQGHGSVTIGKRFSNNRLGLIGSATTGSTERGTEDFEPAYTSGNLTDLDIRSYVVTRRRNGVTAAMDFRPAPTTELSMHTMYNRYIDDHEERQRLRQRVANRRLERELRDRTHLEHIWSVDAEGRHDLARATIDFRITGAHSDQDDPLTIATTFRQSNVNFAPNVTPASIDPDNVQANPLNENLALYTFNQQVRATNYAAERDIVGSANMRVIGPVGSSVASFFKAGFKVRDKNKDRTRDEFTLTSPTTILMSTAAIDDGGAHSILDGRYAFGPYLDLAGAASLPDRFPMNSAVNHARDSEDFTVGEQVTSGYGMVELYLGQKVFVLSGVRYEHTSADFTGNDVRFAPNGAWLSTTPITGGHTYGTVLPSAHLRYAVTPDTNVRFAFTRSLARPNYIDLVPYRSFDDSANTLALGNSDLRPTLAWNTDFMVERYFSSVGLVSAGVFHKQLHDYIYVFTSSEPINGETFKVTQSKNGDSASVTGLELAAQGRMTFLPAPFDGLGVHLNYTFTNSTAVFPGRTGEQATLPGQSRHVGNVAVFYERGGFSGRVAMNFHGSYVDLVSATAGLDRFYDTHKQFDLTFSQRVTKNLQLYLDALNLTDAPLRYYEGVPDRPLQEEHYRWWILYGLKVDWK